MSTFELAAWVMASSVEESYENSLEEPTNWNETALFYMTEDEEKYANSF